MQKIYSLILVVLFSAQLFAQPCNLNVSSPKDTLVCGEGVLLSAFGQAQGNAFLSENFDNGAFGPGWQSTQQATWNNPCGPGPDGTTHIWMGSSSPVPRILTTASFNLSSCANAGVTICFDMKFATQGNTAPCEGPDEPQEGVYLQYSTDNGATWTTLHYFDPNGGNDPQFINWRNWCFPVPQAALTAGTKFRWYQDADSGADYDHWGLDNVVIYCNDPTYSVVWPDGFNSGPTGGTHFVAPRVTTTYTVTMSNGTNTCLDSVKIVVINPTISLNAGVDTTICTGQCTQLHGTANVVQRPAKTPTYTNQEVATVTGTPGFPGFPPFIPAQPGSAYLNMDLNITTLNQATVTNGYITSVCIGSLDMTLGIFGGVDLFDIYLVCPSGDSILLLKDSTVAGSSLTNTCFVPAGGPITAGTTPYSGSYAPTESFNNLSGCDANGVWSLRLRAVINGIALPQGTFNSWSISFNDPELSYQGNFSWSPTTGMTNANTLTPTVCNVPGTYTLTVSDTAGCVTRTDLVAVTDQACCNFSATATPTQATCGANNGSVDVTPSVIDQYTYAWSDGPANTSSRTGLGAGSYTVTITNSSNCSVTRTVVIGSAGAPTLTTSTTGTGCTGNTGSATVTITSGTGTVYNWSSGATTATASNLAAGTYTVTVSGGNCSATASAVVTAAGAPTLTTAATGTTCSGTTGSATVTVTSGTATGYNWSSGATTATASNLAAGTYTVTVTASGGCSATATVTVTSTGGPTLTTSTTGTGCSGNTGSATVNLTSGTATAYNWSSGATTATANNLAAGTYTVTVTAGAGCTATATAQVTSTGGITLSVSSTPTTCGSNGGTATVVVTSGTVTNFIWSGGATTATAANLAIGTYTVTATGGNCSATATIDVTGVASPVTATSNKSIMCGGDSAQICATPGFSTYLWNTGETTSCITVTQGGNYYLTVTDQCNYAAVSNQLPINMFPQPPVSVSVDGDTLIAYGSVSYQWYFNGQPVAGGNTGLLVATDAGSYVVVVADANGCTASSQPIEVSFATGVNELIKESMSVYPNPSQDGNWTLSVSEGWLNGQCEIFDAEGRLVYKTPVAQQKTDIGLNVQSGVYVIRLAKGNMLLSQRLIKL